MCQGLYASDPRDNEGHNSRAASHARRCRSGRALGANKVHGANDESWVFLWCDAGVDGIMAVLRESCWICIWSSGNERSGLEWNSAELVDAVELIKIMILAVTLCFCYFETFKCVMIIVDSI